MNVIETELHGVKILEPAVFGDERGFFLESWNRELFQANNLPTSFVQDNHSRSAQGILRGLHYQTQHTQGKLVRVTSGAVFDVAVDIRIASPSFGKWVGVELSESNHRMLWVPEGFAHGFYVMSEFADFLYKCTDRYDPESECAIRWDDPKIGIEWPLVDGNPPLCSSKDIDGYSFDDAPKFDGLV